MDEIIPLLLPMLVIGGSLFLGLVGVYWGSENRRRKLDVEKKELGVREAEIELRKLEALVELAKHGALESAEAAGAEIVEDALAGAEDEAERLARQEAAAQKAARKL